jgi:hypothetical protein
MPQPPAVIPDIFIPDKQGANNKKQDERYYSAYKGKPETIKKRGEKSDDQT